MKKRKNIIKRKKLALSLILGLFLFAICAILIKYQNKRPVAAVYEVMAQKNTEAVTILLLSDLHNCSFGDGNELLLDQIRTVGPDVICMTGDMLNKDDSDTGIVCDLIQKASAIAPVYFSYGNHEAEYETAFDADLRPALESAGAHVLEKEYEDIEINGQAVRIGGLYGYGMPTQTEFDGEEQRFLEEFQETDSYKILLCHMPAAWIQWGSLDFWDVDLILAGHTHGGQIKVPFLGGMYAPDQGWFPDFTDGCIQKDGKALIVSAGLGSEGLVPRINNKPQIVVIEVKGGALAK